MGWTTRILRRREALLVALFAAAASGSAAAQEETDDSFVVVTPGARYARGALYQRLFGPHWRTLWATPVRVPVLDLESFAGGLTPVRAHTGSQTTSLRLLGADGRQYQFRSVDKDPTNLLAPELRRTVAARVLQDGVSSSHPVGSLVASELLEAAGVLHVKQTLAVLPDDPALGEYRADFANLFGMIEERPDENEEEGAAFAGAIRVTGASRLFERIDDSPNHRVDARAFLTARLVDILLGDRDRHRDQFRWVQTSEERPVYWLPVSRDHDEAFVRLDGPLLGILRRYYHPLVSWETSYSAFHRLNWHSREVDRRFLAGLGREVWDSTATALQQKLSDEVIARAVSQMPPEMGLVAGPEMKRVLVARRDALRTYALGYYAFLAEEVEIRATDADEVAEIVKEDDRTVRVVLRASGEEPYLDRRFDDGETREIRIRMWGGADTVVVRGPGAPDIQVRIVGGKGADRMVDSTTGQHVRFYDDSGANSIDSRTGARIDTGPYEEWVGSDVDRYPPREWGSWTRPLPWVTVNSDLGAFLGGGVRWTRYGFRKAPHATDVSARIGVATRPGAVRADLRVESRLENSGVYTELEVRASGIEILRYHGLGNDSEASAGREFYEVSQQQYRAEASLVLPLATWSRVRVGPFVRWAHTGENPNTLIGSVRDTLTGGRDYGQLGGRLAFEVDTRDKARSPSRGLLLSARGSIVPGLWSAQEAFGGLEGEATTWLQAPLPLEPTLTLRGGGSKIWGRFPFHEAAYVGGESTLRGWSRQRFAGDASLFASVGLRVFLGRTYLALPADYGLFGFTDVARVYTDGSSPEGWHRGLGGGLWVAFLDRNNTATVSVARGGEETRFYFGLGFTY